MTGGSDIQITHSYTYDNGFCGINVESGEGEMESDGSSYKTMKRLYIGYCIAENNPGCPAIKDNHSGNGILIGGVTNGLIEYCEAMNNGWDMPREGNGPVGIWAYMSDSITIQHCYSHHNKTSALGKDGGGFDFDGGMRYSVMQYNLSAFNEGVRNPLAQNLVHFEIEGPGSILAVGSFNPMSIESFRQPIRKAYQGRCLVIIKAENHPGGIHLKVTSTGLNTSEMTINSVAF